MSSNENLGTNQKKSFLGSMWNKAKGLVSNIGRKVLIGATGLAITGGAGYLGYKAYNSVANNLKEQIK